MNYPEKIELVLTYRHDADDPELFTERVEAERCGDFYKLIHVPAFAKNIAYGDIVKVQFEDGEFHFDKLVNESGYSVVHIVIFKMESRDRLVAELNQLRCGVSTNIADNYVVLSIPPAVVYQSVQEYLLIEELSGNIDFRESCLSRLHASNKN
jgi:hypothetical protein